MTKTELKELLNKKENWILLEELVNGKELKFMPVANFKFADLKEANLALAKLKHADLSEADLSYAKLVDADIECADLSNADIQNIKIKNSEQWILNLSSLNIKYAKLLKEEDK